jgi:hypothetical protein
MRTIRVIALGLVLLATVLTPLAAPAAATTFQFVAIATDDPFSLVGTTIMETGRTGTLEIASCGLWTFTVAKYGVEIGFPGNSHFIDKVHWDYDLGAGARWHLAAPLVSCDVGGTRYWVFPAQLEQ